MTKSWTVQNAQTDKGPVRVLRGFLPFERFRGFRLFSFCLFSCVLASATAVSATGVNLPSFSAIPSAANALVLQVQAPVKQEADQFKISNVTGAAGDVLPLKILISKTKEGLEDQFLIFKNLPDGVELAPGGNLGEFWAVNAFLFDQVTLKAPEDFSGSFDVTVVQTGGASEAPERTTKFTATINAPQLAEAPEDRIAVRTSSDNSEPANVSAAQEEQEPKQEQASLQTPSDEEAPPPVTTPAEKKSLNPADKKLMDRAALLFGKGDISGARAVYEYLTSRGSADAAIALGSTYDPVVLDTVVIKGLDANPEKAEYWYRKAEELGSPKARSRLEAFAKANSSD